MKLAPKITKEYVESFISAADVYGREVGNIPLGQSICSPLRKDRNPSMWLFKGDDGQLRHCDGAYPNDPRYSGNWVNLIMSKYGLTFQEAVQKVAQDWGLIDRAGEYKPRKVEDTSVEKEVRKPCEIHVRVGRMRKMDLEYWAQYGISESDLKQEQIYRLIECSVNRVMCPIEPNELAYVYRFEGDKLKLYFPQRIKKDKWKSNVPGTYVEGLERLNGQEKVIVSKSRKDRICLQRLLPEVLVLNVQAERKTAFTEAFRKQIEGKEIYVNFDADSPGKENSLAITKEFGYKHINVPDACLVNGVKDFSDMVRVYGEEEVIKFMKSKKMI